MIINDNYEVAVCGGGIAGISAALSSARQGKKVVLIEKQYVLGGLATAGLVTIYLPLCDGFGHQVSFGIAEELLKLSIKYGAEANYPKNWLDNEGTRTENDQRYKVRYNAQVFAVLVEQLLLKEGVDILYGSYAVGVEKLNDKITSVLIENKSGKTAYRIKSIVDATGDCDIAHFADVPTDTYKQGNILASWYYYTDENGYDLKMFGVADIPDEERTENGIIATTQKRYLGLDGAEISEMVCESHQTLLKDWIKMREIHASAVISTMATIPQIRMTRKIVGEYILSNKEEHVFFDSSVGMVSNWKKRGPVYEIPFETLYNRQAKNLIVAGRCISVNETLWDVMRVIPCCAVTGQAAGTAAALTDDFSSLNITVLQSELKKNGVRLHEKDLI